ncbi:MAG: hypothetical protein WC764_02080 [Candidatus Paceibacterota bacterium]|jgi:hypothetical protein
MSGNLRNRRFVFRNEQCSEADYREKMAQIQMNSYTMLLSLIEEFEKVKRSSIHRFAKILKSNDCTGNSISNSHNVKDSFYIASDGEHVKYCYRGHHITDAYDSSFVIEAEMVYENLNIGYGATRSKFCTNITYSIHDVSYSDACYTSSDLFGCAGLRDKKYCILNKQYSKEDYEALVPKIIEHMKSTGEYGEFFPTALSPFAYNETLAQEYYPLSKDEVLARGYRWKESDAKKYAITKGSNDLPNDIKDVPDTIIKEVIMCAHKDKDCNEMCATAFRIIPAELELYRKMGLPLPRLCPNCRHFARLQKTVPLKLWKRSCMKPGCINEFETSYAPDKPEIVYCESCYQQEVS